LVKDLSVTWYKCPHCGGKYRNEEQAEECMDECWLEMNDDVIEEIDDEVFECEICGKDYSDEDRAAEYEKKHRWVFHAIKVGHPILSITTRLTMR
jgi:hypothetical protein